MILFPLILCIFFAFSPHTGESASVKTTLDAKYTHRESTQTDETDRENEFTDTAERLGDLAVALLTWGLPMTEPQAAAWLVRQCVRNTDIEDVIRELQEDE